MGSQRNKYIIRIAKAAQADYSSKTRSRDRTTANLLAFKRREASNLDQATRPRAELARKFVAEPAHYCASSPGGFLHTPGLPPVRGRVDAPGQGPGSVPF